MQHNYRQLTEELLMQITISPTVAWQYFVYLRWKGRAPACPHCNYTDVLVPTKGKIFRCRNKRCRRKFSPTTNTIFEKSRVPMNLWFKALLNMLEREGRSAYDFYEKTNSVTYDTAWYMVHRIRQLFAIDHDKIRRKTGIHEIDDLMFGLNLTKAAKKTRIRYENIAGYTHRVPIFLCHTREKGNYAKVMCKNTTKAQEQEVIKKVITKKSTVYSDKSVLYANLEKYFAKMKKFNHSKKIYGDGGEGHTNNVNNFAGRFWKIQDRYVRPSSKYLQRYVDELIFYVNTELKNLSTVEKFKLAMSNINRPITRAKLREEGEKNDTWIYTNVPETRPAPPQRRRRIAMPLPKKAA